MIDYYIAGPMRGLTLWNFPAFREACAYVRSLGLTVVSPHELDEAIGFTENTVDLPAGFMAGALRRDVEALLEVEEILLLPGWKHSTGAQFELSVARSIGLKVATYDPVRSCRIIRRDWTWIDDALGEGREPFSLRAPDDVPPEVHAMVDQAAGEASTWRLAEGGTTFLPSDDPWHEVDAEDHADRLEQERDPELERLLAEEHEIETRTGRYVDHPGVPDIVDDANPKDRIGRSKPQLWLVPRAAIIRIAQAMADGARKYGAYNWRTKRVAMTVYVSAIERHLAALLDGEDVAADSGVDHLGHIGACAAILIDARETGNLIDDRPPPGAAARLIAELTEDVPA